MQAFKKTMELNDPRVLAFFPEADSKWSGSVLTIFPTLTALRQTNILNTRLLVPRGPNEFMMLWTVFGRADDDEEMTRHRLRQNNIFGPAGFLGIEDNEALKFLQDGVRKANAARRARRGWARTTNRPKPSSPNARSAACTAIIAT